MDNSLAYDTHPNNFKLHISIPELTDPSASPLKRESIAANPL